MGTLPTLSLVAFLVSALLVGVFFLAIPKSARLQLLKQNRLGVLVMMIGFALFALAFATATGVWAPVISGIAYAGLISVWASTLAGVTLVYGTLVALPDRN